MDTTNEDIDNPLQVWKELTEDDLFRGEMPADIVDRCLQLGRTYVGGVWLQAATTEDIVVTRIKGGLTNQLYKIELAAPIAQGHVETDDQPHAVALKLYYPKHDFLHQFSNHDAFERLPDAIILSMASQAALAPRMFGIFPEGFLQRFYDVIFFGVVYLQAFNICVTFILARTIRHQAPRRPGVGEQGGHRVGSHTQP